MKKRIVVYISLGLIAVLGLYIYFGMYTAQKGENASIDTESVSNNRSADAVERLKNSGAMSEESRLEMVDRLKNAEY